MTGKEGHKSDYVKWFSELSNKDIGIAGGKGASLAEMYVNKFPIPPGFVVTAQAYAYFIDKAGLWDKIKQTLSGFDFEDTAKLDAAAKKVRAMISTAEMPADLEGESLYRYVQKVWFGQVFLAVLAISIQFRRI